MTWPAQTNRPSRNKGRHQDKELERLLGVFQDRHKTKDVIWTKSWNVCWEFSRTVTKQSTSPRRRVGTSAGSFPPGPSQNKARHQDKEMERLQRVFWTVRKQSTSPRRRVRTSAGSFPGPSQNKGRHMDEELERLLGVFQDRHKAKRVIKTKSWNIS